jgi:two-component system, OmpR family, response regulator
MLSITDDKNTLLSGRARQGFASVPWSVMKFMRVLLVEDSQLLAKHLLEQIAAIPSVHALGVVDTELRAVDAIREQHPDVIILDLLLKQGTGFGVLAALAALPKRPLTIVLTNYALPQYRERALSFGVHWFLDKSNEFDKLPEIIGELARSNGSRGAHSGSSNGAVN